MVVLVDYRGEAERILRSIMKPLSSEDYWRLKLESRLDWRAAITEIQFQLEAAALRGPNGARCPRCGFGD